MLALSYGERSACLDRERDYGSPLRSCYSELHSLYTRRGLGHAPVYTGDGILRTPDGDLEYPPGIGVLAALAQRAVNDKRGFFQLNAIAVAGAAAGTVALLLVMAVPRRRIWLFVAAPAMLIHSFTNWEHLAILPLVGGLYAFHRDRPGWGGVLLGLGTVIKVFPAFALPAALIGTLLRGGRWLRGAIAFTTVTAGSLLVAYVWRGEGSLLWIRFSSSRAPSQESIWSIVWRHLRNEDFGALNEISLAALATTSLLIAATLVYEFQRARSERRDFRIIAVAFASMCILLATNKIFSPQVMLMLAPLFVLVRVPFSAWILYAATDVAGQIVHLSYFVGRTHNFDAWPFVHLTSGVRFAVLMGIAILALEAPEAVRGRPDVASDRPPIMDPTSRDEEAPHGGERTDRDADPGGPEVRRDHQGIVHRG